MVHVQVMVFNTGYNFCIQMVSKFFFMIFLGDPRRLFFQESKFRRKQVFNEIFIKSGDKKLFFKEIQD